MQLDLFNALPGRDSGVLVSPVVYVGKFVEGLGSSAQAGAVAVLTSSLMDHTAFQCNGRFDLPFEPIEPVLSPL
jgi:hypothetical protein